VTDEQLSERSPLGLTLSDLQRFGGALEAIVHLADGFRNKELLDGESRWYRHGAPAAADSAVGGLEGDIRDLLGYANVRMAGALELAEFAATVTVRAARGEASHIYAPIVAARAAIEMCAVVSWLVEPEVSALERVARAYTLARSERRGLERYQDGANPDRLDELDQRAAALGLRKVGKGVRRGYLAEMPSLSELVGRLTAESWVYSLLSSVSHGETAGLLYFGYENTQHHELKTDAINWPAHASEDDDPDI
jgi:hypothetical protein